MLERRLGELEEELKVRRRSCYGGRGHSGMLLLCCDWLMHACGVVMVFYLPTNNWVSIW